MLAQLDLCRTLSRQRTLPYPRNLHSKCPSNWGHLYSALAPSIFANATYPTFAELNPGSVRHSSSASLAEPPNFTYARVGNQQGLQRTHPVAPRI